MTSAEPLRGQSGLEGVRVLIAEFAVDGWRVGVRNAHSGRTAREQGPAMSTPPVIDFFICFLRCVGSPSSTRHIAISIWRHSSGGVRPDRLRPPWAGCAHHS
jgi:hypothetical protein